MQRGQGAMAAKLQKIELLHIIESFWQLLNDPRTAGWLLGAL